MTTHEELMALADAYSNTKLDWIVGDTLATQEDTKQARAALSDALKQVVQDAERYRWLRDAEVSEETQAWPAIVMLDDFGCDAIPSDALDSAIDAAMKEKP